ncbi:MAG: transcriptional regulator [Nitrososphaeria archaeon]
MSKDQLIGALLLVGSVIGIIVYGYLLYLYPQLILQITAFVAVAGVLGIVGWIGYTLATTPPPKPIEEIEKEIEKELKSIEGKEEPKTEERGQQQ